MCSVQSAGAADVRGGASVKERITRAFVTGSLFATSVSLIIARWDDSLAVLLGTLLATAALGAFVAIWREE